MEEWSRNRRISANCIQFKCLLDLKQIIFCNAKHAIEWIFFKVFPKIKVSFYWISACLATVQHNLCGRHVFVCSTASPSLLCQIQGKRRNSWNMWAKKQSINLYLYLSLAPATRNALFFFFFLNLCQRTTSIWLTTNFFCSTSAQGGLNRPYKFFL